MNYIIHYILLDTGKNGTGTYIIFSILILFIFMLSIIIHHIFIITGISILSEPSCIHPFSLFILLTTSPSEIGPTLMFKLAIILQITFVLTCVP